MGDAAVSTRGLKSLLGLTNPKLLANLLASGWTALENEWFATGDDKDKAVFNYICSARRATQLTSLPSSRSSSSAATTTAGPSWTPTLTQGTAAGCSRTSQS
eukprot:2978142-Rhodomonas_salina.1